jgi:excinuclease UvrABC ATPase subunit
MLKNRRAAGADSGVSLPFTLWRHPGRGEARQVRLAARLGANLTGVTCVLDEPTIGCTPRSVPASWVGFLTEIRGLMAQMPEARARVQGLALLIQRRGRRCPACRGQTGAAQGLGWRFCPMSAGPVPGARDTDQTLAVRYSGPGSEGGAQGGRRIAAGSPKRMPIDPTRYATCAAIYRPALIDPSMANDGI